MSSIIKNETALTDLRDAIRSAKDEPAEDGIRRRDFLSILGASFVALTGQGCYFRAPKEKIIPYLVQPEDAASGVANWYASTCSGCQEACGILVKNRDGRPIKLEGNPDHPLSRGGLCARGQATVLDLYDSQRFKGPTANASPTDWETIDATIREQLSQIKDDGGQIRILSSTISSPTAQRAIAKFIEAYPTARHLTYDSISSSAILDVHKITHGQRLLPKFYFDKAEVIVGFDADFLGTWIAPVEFTRAWAEGRTLDETKKTMSRHIQFEATMTVTGANADLRFPVAPSNLTAVILELAHRLGERLARPEAANLPRPAQETPLSESVLDALVDELTQARGRSLLVCGSDDMSAQLAVNLMNHWLGNYGNTLDVAQPSYQYQGNDGAIDELFEELENGQVAALIIYNANPAYDLPRAKAFQAHMEKVPLTISLSDRQDETAKLTKYVCPDHHSLESWGDAQPQAGVYTLFQPTIAPLYQTRAAVETFMAWAGESTTAYDLVQATWDEQIFIQLPDYGSFTTTWNKAVHDGVLVIARENIDTPPFIEKSAEAISYKKTIVPPGAFEVLPYPSAALFDGRQANNPWLQELPDPITKVTWGNYASISPKTAKALAVDEGQILELKANGHQVRLPAQIQNGMADNVVALALGYGRSDAGNIAANYPIQKMFPIEKELLSGADVFPFLAADTVTVTVTDQRDRLAKSQIFDYQVLPFTHENRNQIQETTLHEFASDPHAGNDNHHEMTDLWPEYKYEGHKWAMSIDLNRCTGCSACVIACQAENNTPVVGKVEVRKNRDMQWMRIDRYYSGAEDDSHDNPDVSFQPMFCQHCDHAPCETVCPVLATTHSSEGLNMQVYNRCVGTKYCANNCPYKVRHFNWFDYAHDDPVQNLVLNPDVTVRPRGVMEKCTFCVQRINGAKRQAKQEGRTLADGDIMPACVQSCPAGAMTFGDINDPNSKVAKASKDPRSYRVLEVLGTRPSVDYLTKVRNKKA